MRKDATLILILVLLSSVCAHGQDDVLRVDTSVVLVPANVVDRNGLAVRGLTKANFRLFEDRVEQKIVGFETDSAPFELALMIDVSSSVKFSLHDIEAAASEFVDQLRPEDHVTVFAFGHDLVKLYSGERRAFPVPLTLPQAAGSTALYDTVEKALTDYLSRSSYRKKALVLFTDGIDTSSKTDLEQSLHTAQESALIYTIQYDTTKIVPKSDKTLKSRDATLLDIAQGHPVGVQIVVTPNGEPIAAAYKRGTHYLKTLSLNSGAKYYLADTPDNLAKIFAGIAADLREQYVLVYSPEGGGTNAREIRVKVEVPNAKIRSRRSYTPKAVK